VIDDGLTAAGLPGMSRSVWVEVDIDQLTANAAALRRMVSPAGLGAVVKADGYGHGLEMTARCAVTAGAEWLCVATIAEGMRLRRDGYTGQVLVLYPPPVSMLGTAAREGLDISVGSLEMTTELARGQDGDPPLRVHVEVDTGMTRGGVHPRDLAEATTAIAAGTGSPLIGVWTHLAAPEDPDVTSAQVALFESAVRDLHEDLVSGLLTHLAASGGILTLDAAEYSFVRAGLALYGAHPGAGRELPPDMGPALSVKAMPVRVSRVTAGTRVGYGGDWEASRDSVLATLPIGYADGWSRSSSPGGRVLVEGRRAPLVGRVSSDAVVVDVTDIPGVGTDTEFVLLGRQGGDMIDADEVAATRGTISWEVLQQLGGRLARVYVSNGEPVAVRPETVVEVVWGDSGQAVGYGSVALPLPGSDDTDNVFRVRPPTEVERQ
jgi:alanine racemase